MRHPVISKMLIDMARFYGYELGERQLEMYADVLSQMPEGDVLEAGRRYVQNPKNDRFPIPPHKILAGAQADDRSIALEASSRVMGAVRKFGWAQPREAQEFIGELGWRAVQRFGDWPYICEHLGTHALPLTTFQAQVRDLCEATLKLGEAGVLDQAPALPQGSGRVNDLINQTAERLSLNKGDKDE